MNNRSSLLSVFLGFALISPALGDATIPWPIPAPPAGSNSADLPTARLDWPLRVQWNIGKSRKMPQLDLIFDGDSITDFWMTNGRAVWMQKYAPLNAYDFGIGGDRTENVLWRLQYGQVDGLHPKMVVLMIGTNNLGSNSVAQIAEAITAIVNEYRKRCPEAVILLQGIFPRAESPTDVARPKIKKINELISKLDDGKNIIFVDFGDKFLQPDGTLTKDIMGDFLHPTAKGYQIWADAIQPVIDKYFPPSSPAPAPPSTPVQ